MKTFSCFGKRTQKVIEIHNYESKLDLELNFAEIVVGMRRLRQIVELHEESDSRLSRKFEELRRIKVKYEEEGRS